MSVSIAAPWVTSLPAASEPLAGAAARMAARCGDDVVRLRPAWPPLIAVTRFARHTRWSFGNAIATLTCTEPKQRRWLTQRNADDQVQVQFDFSHWSSAYAFVDGGAREIDVFAADGTGIASVRLDDIDATLDELLWQLAADDQRPSTPSTRDRAEHACTLRAPYALAPGSLESTLAAACDANLPLRVSVRNAGGMVTWTPVAPKISHGGSPELRSAHGMIALRIGPGAGHRVGLSDPYRGEPRLEAIDASDRTCFSVALHDAGPLQRLAWRGLCSNLT